MQRHVAGNAVPLLRPTLFYLYVCGSLCHNATQIPPSRSGTNYSCGHAEEVNHIISGNSLFSTLPRARTRSSSPYHEEGLSILADGQNPDGAYMSFVRHASRVVYSVGCCLLLSPSLDPPLAFSLSLAGRPVENEEIQA